MDYRPGAGKQFKENLSETIYCGKLLKLTIGQFENPKIKVQFKADR